MRMLRRILAACGLLIGALALAAAGFVALNLDDPPIDDSDLTARPPTGDEARNAYPCLHELLAPIDVPERDEWAAITKVARGEAWDPELVEMRLRADAVALERLPVCLALPEFRLPVPNDVNEDIAQDWEMVRLTALANLLRLRAVAAARAGDTPASLAESEAIIRLGALVASDPEPLLSRALSALSVQMIGASSLSVTLRFVTPTRDQARELAGVFAASHTDPARWRPVWAAEYRLLRAHIRDLDERAPDPALLDMAYPRIWTSALVKHLPGRYWYKPNATHALLAAGYRQAQADVGHTCPPKREAPRGPGRAARWIARVGSNAGGRALADIVLTDFGRFEVTRCLRDTRLAAAEAWLALRAFEGETGSLPQSLEALVPAYLPEVPGDGFGGAALGYDPLRRLVYSIGEAEESRGGGLLFDPQFPIPVRGDVTETP